MTIEWMELIKSTINFSYTWTRCEIIQMMTLFSRSRTQFRFVFFSIFSVYSGWSKLVLPPSFRLRDPICKIIKTQDSRLFPDVWLNFSMCVLISICLINDVNLMNEANWLIHFDKNEFDKFDGYFLDIQMIRPLNEKDENMELAEGLTRTNNHQPICTLNNVFLLDDSRQIFRICLHRKEKTHADWTKRTFRALQRTLLPFISLNGSSVLIYLSLANKTPIIVQ